MAYKYKHFIPQNIAPSGAKSIGVYNQNSEKICTIPLGRLAPTTKEKLYSFGLLSDIHLFHLPASWNPNPKFDNALTNGILAEISVALLIFIKPLYPA